MNPQLKSKFAECCDTCLMFAISGSRDNETIGYCRCNPPTPRRDSETGKMTVGQFPIVLGSMWCGQWYESEPKERN